MIDLGRLKHAFRFARRVLIGVLQYSRSLIPLIKSFQPRSVGVFCNNLAQVVAFLHIMPGRIDTDRR